MPQVLPIAATPAPSSISLLTCIFCGARHMGPCAMMEMTVLSTHEAGFDHVQGIDELLSSVCIKNSNNKKKR